MYDFARRRTYIPGYDIWITDAEAYDLIRSRYNMAASNQSVNVTKIHNALGNPPITSHAAADSFTAHVAATLHFGSASLDIKPDANWGRRRNPSGILSDDVLSYNGSTVQHFDYIQNAGAANWRFIWDSSTPGPWVAPDPDDVVGGADPGNGNGGDPQEPGEPGPHPILAEIDEVEEILKLNLEVLRDLADTLHGLRTDNEQLRSEVIQLKNELVQTKNDLVAPLIELKNRLDQPLDVRIRLR